MLQSPVQSILEGSRQASFSVKMEDLQTNPQRGLTQLLFRAHVYYRPKDKLGHLMNAASEVSSPPCLYLLIKDFGCEWILQ